MSAITPVTLWAQTKDRLLVSFCVQDTKDVDVRFETGKILFSSKGGTANQPYVAELLLLKDIDPQQCKWDRTSRLVTVVAVKKDAGPFWPRLLQTKVKQHWLKVDFDKMRDSDESSGDEMGDGAQPDLSEMMAQMGRGTGSVGLEDLENEDDEDSDNEHLPDLETADSPNNDEATDGDEICQSAN